MSDDLPKGVGQDAPDGPRSPEAAASPSPAGRDSGPRRSVLLIAVIVVVVALALAGIGAVLWVRHTKTPEYSLAQLSKAARSSDWAGVQRYVDIDAIADNLIEQATEGAFNQGNSDDKELGAKMAKGMKPAFIKRLEEDLQTSVETGDAGRTSELSAVVLSGEPKSVTVVGDGATVVVEVPVDGGGTRDVSVTMDSVDDHWRIVALSGTTD